MVDSDLDWQSPPPPIAQILDAPPPPTLLLSPDNQWWIELEQPLLPAIAELAEPEIAVAGFRLNPNTYAPARQSTYRSLKVGKFPTSDGQMVSLPAHARISLCKWSPDCRHLAFTLTQPNGLELWVLELETATARALASPGGDLPAPVLNATYGTPCRWLNNDTLLCKCVPNDCPLPPQRSAVPAGPIVQENLGRKTPNRTYTNLLESPHDEALFEYYVTSTLEAIGLDGTRTRLVEPCLIDEARPSPDSQYILLKTLHRPYSYQLPAGFFPKQIQVLDAAGAIQYEVADLPLADSLSTKFDAVRPGRRRVFWRSDRPATLYWVEALDDGDPDRDVPYRDAVLELDAPFTDSPRLLWKSELRFRRIQWGRDDLALAWESWYDTRRQRLWRLNPTQPNCPTLLVDRSSEDRYRDPGAPLTVLGAFGRDLLHLTPDGEGIYFSGRGASPQGVYPFLDRLDIHTGERSRIWQCQDPYFEGVAAVLDDAALLTRRQSQTEPPNYFLHHNGSSVQLTHYDDPAPQFAGVQKELVRYQRSDGVQLTANLYLPPGYDRDRDGALPTVFWVYPAEFKDRELAGQITTATNTFSRPYRTSVLFLLTQGYAVLDDPSLPIVGEGSAEPNDSYVEQLIASTEAAINYVVDRGVSDRNRLAIGGHSYGGFTTANLLAHTDLFRAGIAMSGAYNRTLTPFGFQGEQRTFWEAPETYIQMSPFAHAAKITAPLLLIHGGDDSNAGTYPIQTERLYEALKGLGATVRWVVLPLEDHGYRSREAVGHVLWEMVRWGDRYLKG